MKNSTKLTDDQKARLKKIEAAFTEKGGAIVQYKQQGLTICVAPTNTYAGKRDADVYPKFYELSAAYCNNASDRFRVKVGKYMALENFDAAMTVKIPSGGYKTAQDIATEFAASVAKRLPIYELCYNSVMDENSLHVETYVHMLGIWATFCSTYPELKAKPAPLLTLNARLRSNAAFAYTGDECARIDLGLKFLRDYYPYMVHVIIPHELAHIADYWLNGKQRDCHGHTWQAIMLEYGLPADKFHTMELA